MLVVTLVAMLFGLAQPAHAVDQVSVEDLQAAMRTLVFLESLPKSGTIVVGVVYPSDDPAAEVMAAQTARVIGTLRGPNSRMLQPLLVSINNLDHLADHLDVIFLVTGSSKYSDAILNIMHRSRLVSISDDPACADAKCCVLTVHTGQRVEITLNTSLADTVGARFSSVFTMVVKRK